MSKILAWLAKFLGVKRREIVRIKPTDVEKLNRALEKDRGYARGTAAAEKIKREKLEQKIKQKEINVSEYLYKKSKELQNKQYYHAFSLRSFFKKLNSGKNFDVLSYNFKKKFGSFHDMVILRDGRIGIIIKTEKGNIKPILTGRDIKQIFRNFGGLSQTVGRGHFIINEDEDGMYVENIEEREVPNIVLDGRGKLVLTAIDQDAFIERLKDKEMQFQQLAARLKQTEELLMKQHEVNKELELDKQMAVARAETAEGNLVKSLKEVSGIVGMSYGATTDMARVNYARKLAEERADALNVTRQEIFDKLKQMFPRDIADEEKAKIEDATEWIMDTIVTRGSQFIKAATPEKVEVKPTLKPVVKKK